MTVYRKHYPLKQNDSQGTAPFSGGALLFSSLEGRREAQEDRFLLRTGIALGRERAADLLKAMFDHAQGETRSLRAGSTATAAFLTADMTLHARFIGDSPLLLFTFDPATGVSAVEKITRDHHAYLPAEKKLVTESGGDVSWNGLVDGRLALSRAFGDVHFKGVSRASEAATIDLAAYQAEGKQVFICLASDGLFGEHMDEREYLPVFAKAVAEGKTHDLPAIFARHAVERGSEDNVTVLALAVPDVLDAALFLCVADGHGGKAAAEKVIAAFSERLPCEKPLPAVALKRRVGLRG